MTLQLQILPVVALIAGVIILIAPRFLNYAVAIYLVLVGITGLFPGLLSGL